MRIVHLIPYFYPAWAYGGTPRAVYEIARRQVKEGDDVTVITTNAYEKDKVLDPGVSKIEGIKVIRLNTLSNFLTWKFHFPIPLKFKFTNEKFDVVHLHETRTLLNLFFLISGDFKKVLFSPWGTLPVNDRFLGVKYIFDFLVINILRKYVDRAIVQTSHEARVVRDWKISKDINILPLGIDFSFFRDLPDRKESRKNLGLNTQDFVFLFLGRFSRVKGLEILLESFKRFAKDRTGVKLVLVGRNDGYLEEMIKKLKNEKIDDKVIISGPLYERDRLYAYQAADCFIFTPIVFEETSTACLEALACGVPVITVKQSEIPFLQAEDGLLQIDNSIENIVKSMNEVYSKKNKVNTGKVKSYFDWDNIVSNIKKIYEE